MSELIEMGVPIELDTVIIKADDGTEKEEYVKRNLIFNYNVIRACIDKFGSMDDILNGVNHDTVLWLASLMVNEDAKIWNKKHPDKQIPFLSEDDIGMYTIGVQGPNKLIEKVREAMFLGLPKEQVHEVEELEKNLMTAQSQKLDQNGKMSQLLKRFLKKEN